jgi:hypothetical protein
MGKEADMLLLSATNRSEVVGVDDRGTGLERCSAARRRDLVRKNREVAARALGTPGSLQEAGTIMFCLISKILITEYI